MILFKKAIKGLIFKYAFCIPPLLNNYNMKIPSIYGLGFHNRIISEKWMSNLIVCLFKAEPQIKVFLDVGVNIGQTLLKLKAINRDIKYIGFEPNSDCCFYTRRLSEINCLPNVQIVPCALSDGHGLATLYSDELGASDATIVKDLRDREYVLPSQHVVRFSFDELSPSLVGEERAIVKIDVEGGELEVLSGMTQYKDHEFFE
jgi:FkbM family methyltransferase